MNRPAIFILIIMAIELMSGVSAAENEAFGQPPLDPQQLGYQRHSVDIVLAEPLGLDWPHELVIASVSFTENCHPSSLQLRDADGRLVEFQVVDPVMHRRRWLRACSIAFITSLKPYHNLHYTLHYDSVPPPDDKPASDSKPPADSQRPDSEPPVDSERPHNGGASGIDGSLRASVQRTSAMRTVLSTGKMSVRVLASSGLPDKPLAAHAAPPPIDSFRGADGVWRGTAEMLSPYEVVRWNSTVTASGPVFAEVVVEFEFTGWRMYRVAVRAVAGADWITVHESFNMGDKSCFILRDSNRNAEQIPEQPSYRRPADVIARLPSYALPGSTIAGLPATRFASVAAVDGRDTFLFFTVAPGEWANPAVSGINYLGSGGNLLLHFPLENGSRRWAVSAGTLEEFSTANILARIARASDFTLQTVLDMKLDRGQSVFIDKGTRERPQELQDAADTMLDVVTRLQNEGYSSESFWNSSLPAIARAADVYRIISDAEQMDSSEADALYSRLAAAGHILEDASFFNHNVLLHDAENPAADIDVESFRWLLNVRRIHALAKIAAAFPEYRRASSWLAHAERQMKLMLDYLVDDTGEWIQRADHQQARALMREISEILQAAGRTD